MDSERRLHPDRGPGDDPGQLIRLHARLLARLETLTPACIALSGGVDSRLLCELAAQSMAGPGGFLAAHVRGPHVPGRETQRARECCRRLGIEFLEIELAPAEVAQMRGNAASRCYHCKREVFSRMGAQARERGFDRLLDGSNASDLGTHRPGLAALDELGVISPFADAGLHKEQLRTLARGLGLPQWSQPARPCLLTRLAYDMPVDPGLLGLLDQAEERLERAGFREFRLRVTRQGDTLLQLAESELDLWDLQGEGALDYLEEVGLGRVAVQTAASVSGWHDAGSDGGGGATGSETEKKLDKS